MKSNITPPQDTVPLPRESRFNPYGSDLLTDDKFNYDHLPPHDLDAAPSQPLQAPQYSESESFFAFLAPGDDNADLPELDFPVPAPDIIPDMVFENDHNEDSTKAIGYTSPDSYYGTATSPPALTSSYLRSSSSDTSPLSSNQHESSHIIPFSTRSSSSTSPCITTQRHASKPTASSVSPSPSLLPYLTQTSLADSNARIPIQSSYVAHARVGSLSVAAIQERRARNTQSARRSRARRADKMAELREENKLLILRNRELTSENAELKRMINALNDDVRSSTPQRTPIMCSATMGGSSPTNVKSEVPESPYQSF